MQPCEAGWAGTDVAPCTAIPVFVKYFGLQRRPRSEIRQPFGSSLMIEKPPSGVTALPVAIRPPSMRSRNGTFEPVDALSTATVRPSRTMKRI